MHCEAGWIFGSGSHHMQEDLDLLAQTLQDGCPRWRFYVWDHPTLSLGRHQSPPDLPALIPFLPWVQRPTGGRAVLHGAGLDLTYAFTWLGDPKMSRRQAYGYLCQILQQAVADFGIPLTLGSSSGYQHHSSCFASHTHADLTWHSYKVIGSAQLWQQGVVLQHGTMLLAPDYDLWERTLPGSQIRGLHEIAADLHLPPPSRTALCQALCAAAQRHLITTQVPLP